MMALSIGPVEGRRERKELAAGRVDEQQFGVETAAGVIPVSWPVKAMVGRRATRRDWSSGPLPA